MTATACQEDCLLSVGRKCRTSNKAGQGTVRVRARSGRKDLVLAEEGTAVQGFKARAWGEAAGGDPGLGFCLTQK